MRQSPRGVPIPAATLTTRPLLDEAVGEGSGVVLVELVIVVDTGEVSDVCRCGMTLSLRAPGIVVVIIELPLVMVESMGLTVLTTDYCQILGEELFKHAVLTCYRGIWRDDSNNSNSGIIRRDRRCRNLRLNYITRSRRSRSYGSGTFSRIKC